MIIVEFSPKGTPYVWAKDLYQMLTVKASFDEWIKEIMEYGFDCHRDYAKVQKKSKEELNDNEIPYDYAIKLEMAKHIAMCQRTDTGKKLREYLVLLEQGKADGKLLDHQQIIALIKILKVLGYFTVQEFLEKEHFDFYNKPKEWWKYRASLLGYDANQLKEMLAAKNKEYKSQRQALMHIKKNELIRAAVIDLFMSMGKSEVCAKNTAGLMEKLADDNRPEIYNDKNTSIDFKSDDEKKIINILMSNKIDGSLFKRLG